LGIYLGNKMGWGGDGNAFLNKSESASAFALAGEMA